MTGPAGTRLGFDDARRLCLALPGAFEDTPFGPDRYVYKVRGRATSRPRMFALLWGESDTVGGVGEQSGDQGPGGAARLNLKVDPTLGEQLRAAHPQITPGYHMNKRHWVTVVCAGLERRMVADLIEDAYDLVVASLPRADREALGWRRLAEG
ncbi:MmcQ/YjbR family DNA-binding protein [Zhihengliuella somnathii]